jgi:hypothetical protein
MMYGAPKMARVVVQDWAEELAERFGVAVDLVRSNAEGVLDYPSERVLVELMDGSKVDFTHAFFIWSERKRAVAVFSEHCGHHVFPYHEAVVFVEGKRVAPRRDGQ